MLSIRSCCGSLDKSLALYPGVPSSIPGSGSLDKSLALYPGVPSSIPGWPSLLDETLYNIYKLYWPCLHMTIAVGGMLNTLSLLFNLTEHEIVGILRAVEISCSIELSMKKVL